MRLHFIALWKPSSVEVYSDMVVIRNNGACEFDILRIKTEKIFLFQMEKVEKLSAL